MLKWSCQFVFKSSRVASKTQCVLRWNHYKALGLSPSATSAEIKAAYYKLSKIYHPDRNNGSEASAKKFRDIVAAYEILGKADSRKQYDREFGGNYMSRNPNLGPKKKRNKRNANSSRAASQSHIHKYNEKFGLGGRKGMSRSEQEDFEFIVRAIPIVVACLMGYRK